MKISGSCPSPVLPHALEEGRNQVVSRLGPYWLPVGLEMDALGSSGSPPGNVSCWKLVSPLYQGGNTVEMSTTDLQALLTVREVAEMHGVAPRVVRKAVRNGTIPGHVEVLGKSGFDPEVVSTWTPPEPGTRVVGAKRADGRQRYRLMATPDEAATLLAQGYEISDPREAAKARRKARNAAKAEGDTEPSTEAASEDLFEDFDV